MKALLLVIVLIAAAAFAATANAKTATWIPGSSYLVEELDASDLLEHTYDHAYCQGVPRFGHSGEFPYERFRVFDCSMEFGSLYCPDYRWRAAKARRYGYFNLLLVTKGTCY